MRYAALKGCRIHKDADADCDYDDGNGDGDADDGDSDEDQNEPTYAICILSLKEIQRSPTSKTSGAIVAHTFS